MGNMTDKSPLQAALEAKTRKLYSFDVSECLGIEGAALRIRVATKFEQDRALIEAHKYVRSLAANDEKAAADPDILNDAKSAFIAFEVTRDATSDMPAFNSGRDMLRTLTADQIAYILNLANSVRYKESPGPKDIPQEELNALVEMCFEYASEEIPDAVLAGYSREYLTHMVVALSCELKELRAEMQQHKEDAANA